jgi:hypothetical protein
MQLINVIHAILNLIRILANTDQLFYTTSLLKDIKTYQIPLISNALKVIICKQVIINVYHAQVIALNVILQEHAPSVIKDSIFQQDNAFVNNNIFYLSHL